MEVRRAKNQSEVDEGYELGARTFGPSYFESRERYNRRQVLEPLRSFDDAVVVADGKEVLGFGGVIETPYNSPIGVVKAGRGIGVLCVHPDLRGQGWGLRLIEGLLQVSQERGHAFSVVFARRAVDGWFPKLGYAGIGCHLEMQIEKPSAAGALAAFNGSIQAGCLNSSVDLYAEAYADSYKDLFLSAYRDDGWWSTLEDRLAYSKKIDTKDFVNVMVGDNPIGYFITSACRVIEVASLPRHRFDVAAGLLQHCMASSGERLVLALPSGHWCVGHFRGMNHTLNIRYSWDGGHMVRILNKGVFKEMVMRTEASESHGAVESLFDQHDVSEHEGARRLLLTIAGASPTVQSQRRMGNGAVPGDSFLPMLPTWSILDEQ